MNPADLEQLKRLLATLREQRLSKDSESRSPRGVQAVGYSRYLTGPREQQDGLIRVGLSPGDSRGGGPRSAARPPNLSEQALSQGKWS